MTLNIGFEQSRSSWLDKIGPRFRCSHPRMSGLGDRPTYYVPTKWFYKFESNSMILYA